MQAHQQRLGFGIAKAAIEFENTRPLVSHHDAGVEHAAKRTPAAFHGMDDRHKNGGLNLLQQLGRRQRRRAVGTHAAGVWALVIIKGGLVILCRLKHYDRSA